MKFGISSSFTCNYLPEEKERLLIYYDEEGKRPASPQLYGALLTAGFRRSGEQIYRPHCESCQRCESLRIAINEFKLSKSQKRIRNKNQHLTVTISQQETDCFYPLYEAYINGKHRDGGMFPPSKEQFNFFIHNQWQQPLYICVYDDQQLIAVAVTDEQPDSLSALYTFYDPKHEHLSLGTFSILAQLDVAARLNKRHLYLGYYIENCQKMRYKKNFLPHERFIDGQWQHFKKEL